MSLANPHATEAARIEGMALSLEDGDERRALATVARQAARAEAEVRRLREETHALRQRTAAAEESARRLEAAAAREESTARGLRLQEAHGHHLAQALRGLLEQAWHLKRPAIPMKQARDYARRALEGTP